jgi:NADPH-dependent curcumin reductase CurA
MTYQNTKQVLIKRPKGMPDDNCWEIKKETLSYLKKNEVLIKVKYLSIDPYMRGRMNEGLSYASPLKLGDTMVGESVGEVIESKSNLYKVGDILCAHKGWQTLIKTKDTDLSLYKVNSKNLPISLYLGSLGMPGRTAYFGLNKVAKPKKGETVVVSAASGAVGSVVGQLARSYGCRVIGIAGGTEKCSYVKETLKFDDCIDYKSDYLKTNLEKACNNGIDIYFENVGGSVTKAVTPLLNHRSRVPICGFISQYNNDDLLSSETPFHILKNLNTKPIYRFFVVHEWVDEFESATEELTEMVLNKKILYKETITKGFENAPQALRDVLSGKNFGKQIIEI